MPVRPATYVELLPASKCLAAAFKEEHMFGIYMHPNQSQYPDDMYLQFLHMIRMAYFSGSDHQVLVSYKNDSTGKEVITGLAHWTRFRKDAKASLYTTTRKNAMSWYNYLESFIYPNRAADPSRTGVLQKLGPFCRPFWSGSRGEVWDLTLLGVDPAAGGQGFGRELVAWGFEKAREEGVGCSVVASEGKEKFYQACGYDTIVGSARDHGGMENPLNKYQITGGTILFWDNGRAVE